MDQNDLQFNDENDIELYQNEFCFEHLKRMIKKTFQDYYPQQFNRRMFSFDEYLTVV